MLPVGIICSRTKPAMRTLKIMTAALRLFIACLRQRAYFLPVCSEEKEAIGLFYAPDTNMRGQPAEANFVTIAQDVRLVGNQPPAVDVCTVGAAYIDNLHALRGVLNRGVQSRNAHLQRTVFEQINIRLVRTISITAT